MKKLLLFLPALLILSACGHNVSQNQKNMKQEKDMANKTRNEFSFPGGYFQVNKTESQVTWRGEKAIGASHEGTIDIKSGYVQFDDGEFRGGEFVIDMTSIKESQGSERLEGHLKSNDFFASEQFPEAKFVIKEIVSVDDGFTVTADLTIRDKTNEVEFIADMNFAEDKLEASAEAVIDRTLFDVRYGSGKFFDNLGDNLIKDEFTVKFSIIAREEV